MPCRCFFEDRDSPCNTDVCTGANADSEACQMAVAEYCLTHPTDTGCDLFVPTFERELGVQSLTVHVNSLVTDGVPRLALADCGG